MYERFIRHSQLEVAAFLVNIVFVVLSCDVLIETCHRNHVIGSTWLTTWSSSMGALQRGPGGPWPIQNYGWMGHNAFGPTNNWPVWMFSSQVDPRLSILN